MGIVELSSVGAAQNATYAKQTGNKVKLYGLGSDDAQGNAGAFHDISQAIDEAKHFIFIADWSFQPYVRLKPRTGNTGLLETVGAQLHFAAVKNKATDLLVAIHAWNHTKTGAADDLNDAANKHLDFIASGGGRGKRDPNVLWRISSRGGLFFSLHQKFVVLDALQDGERVVKAFFGGLDLTKGRFDSGEHPILPPGGNPEPFASAVTGKILSPSQLHPFTTTQPYDDWYNAEFGDDRELPRQPWNDYHGRIVGPAAWDIAREFVGRWNCDDQPAFNAGDRTFSDKQRVQKKFLDLFSKSDLKKPFEDHGGPFTAQVLRSISRTDWGPLQLNTQTIDADTLTKDGKTQREFTWRLGGATFEKSIQEAYLHSIDKAERFIYIETQYLIGSGARWQKPRPSVKNGVPGAIVDKLVQKIGEDKPFHAYLVVPMFPEGDPVSAAGAAQRQFQFETMRFMAQRVFVAANAKGRDWKDFLSFYFLANWTSVDKKDHKLLGSRKRRVRANKRYMIYVHSKLMIIDDEFVILGSANLNERSLAGDRDAEICVALFADKDKLKACKDAISGLRLDAWKRHLGEKNLPNDKNNPENASCAQHLQSKGRENWAAMAATTRDPTRGHLINLPFDATATTFAIRAVSGTAELREQDRFIFDADSDPAGLAQQLRGNGTTSDNKWLWSSPLTLSLSGILTETGINIAE